MLQVELPLGWGGVVACAIQAIERSCSGYVIHYGAEGSHLFFNDRAEILPPFGCFIQGLGASWHMKGGIGLVAVIENIVRNIKRCSPINIAISQTATTQENTSPDAGYTIWDGDAGQAATARESIATDAGLTIWDGDAGQAATATVFISYCISTK